MIPRSAAYAILRLSAHCCTRGPVIPIVPAPLGVVLDVGVIEGRGWAVVEANAAWGSGIYGCDPAAILPVLARACSRREVVEAADMRWIIRE